MKGIMSKVGVALTAFCVGVGCELAFKRYLETTSPVVFELFPEQPELIALINPTPEKPDTQLPAGSLPNVLRHIDENYQKRCQLPTDWYGDWPTIKQLAEFRVCNDKWANARRKAINAELRNYMVQY